MQEPKEDRSIGDLFAELASNMTLLVRQELDLAKTEMTQKATRAGRDVGMIGAGGALAYAGLLALIAAVILGLGHFIPVWLSAFVVGLVVVGVGYMLIQKGLNGLKHIDPTPQATVETLKEGREWAKDQTR